jgi:hypothetical protein
MRTRACQAAPLGSSVSELLQVKSRISFLVSSGDVSQHLPPPPAEGTECGIRLYVLEQRGSK